MRKFLPQLPDNSYGVITKVMSCYNPNNVVGELTLVNGIRSGPETSYYPSGNLRSIVFNKDGDRNGLERWFYDTNIVTDRTFDSDIVLSTGPIQFIASYKEGLLHGRTIDYNISGNIFSEQCYLYGNEVTELEYREHELIEELARI